MNLVTKDGKPVDLSKLDESVKTVLEAAFGGITHQMTAAMTATLKPIEEKLGSFNPEQITELTELVKKNAQGEQGKENPPKTESDDPAMKSVLEMLQKLSDRLDENENQTKEQREASEASQRTTAYFEKNLPNLKGKEVFINRIAASKPKDDDAVKAEFEKIRAEQEAIYGKEAVEKTFSADASSEGSEKVEPDTVEAELKEKMEYLDNQLKK